MTQDSQFRAVVAKNLLANIRKLPQGAKVLAHLDPALVQRADQAAALSWLPMEDLGEVIEKAGQSLSLPLFEELIRKNVMQTLDHDLFKNAAGMLIRIFGLTPKSFIKALPPMYGLVYRNYGQVSCEELGPGELTFDWKMMPPALSGPFFATGLRGGFQGFYTLCKVDGTVELRRDEVNRNLSLRFRWSSAPKRAEVPSQNASAARR
jgi:hypothetical protein